MPSLAQASRSRRASGLRNSGGHQGSTKSKENCARSRPSSWRITRAQLSGSTQRLTPKDRLVPKRMLSSLSLFDGAHGEALDQLARDGEAEDDDRQDDQGARRHDLTPGQFIAAHETVAGTRHLMGPIAGQHQRVEQLVPGKDERKDG